MAAMPEVPGYGCDGCAPLKDGKVGNLKNSSESAAKRPASRNFPGLPIEVPGYGYYNVCERALKKAILHRKNALFYKTQNGARVGDLFMSLIYTCQLNQANPFDYLTQLQRHADAACGQPPALDAVELPRRAGLSVDDSGRAVRVDPPWTKATTRGIETMPKRQPKPRRAVPSRKQPGPTAELRRR